MVGFFLCQSGLTATAESIHQLESKIESAVLAKLPQCVAMDQDDVTDRVQDLESRFNNLLQRQQQLESVVCEQGAQQTAQLGQMQSQINAQGQQLAGHMEVQQQQLQTMFESQMAQIRGLLSKRPRDDQEWLSEAYQQGGGRRSRGIGPILCLSFEQGSRPSNINPFRRYWMCWTFVSFLFLLYIRSHHRNDCGFSNFSGGLSWWCHACFRCRLALTCAQDVTSSTAKHLFEYNSGFVVKRSSSAGFTPVWPHVLDLWCADLVVLSVVLTLFTSLGFAFLLIQSFGICILSLRSRESLQSLFPSGLSRGQVGVGHLSRWWTVLVGLTLLHRGEALNPGPCVSNQLLHDRDRTWSMGTFNPSGLGGKQQVVSSYLNHGDLWAVSETHLTSQGMRSFQGLKWSDSEFVYCVGGHPVPLRSHSCVTGSWNGVAVLSKFPTRAVPVPWSDQVFETSRAQITTTLCGDLWVTGGVLYGEPPGGTHPNAKDNTDVIALDIVTHLCQLSGLRFLAGDFNFEKGGLEVFQALENAGFRDIQDVAFERWGKPVCKTCKHSTRKDYFFISRELIPFLREVSVDETVWADHAVVQGFFSCAPQQLCRYHWRQPRNVSWPESFKVQFSSQFQQENDPTSKYTLLWKEVEQAASRTYVEQGKPALSSKQSGRGATLDTELVRAPFHRGPVRAGRASDVQPLFARLSQQHAHWFRQLRRIQSFVHFRKVHDSDTPQGHGVNLWSSILRAKGFEGPFTGWWERHSSRVFGAPISIPLSPPRWEVAVKIYESFLIDVRSLESLLRSQRCKHARDKRKELAHMIFKDIQGLLQIVWMSFWNRLKEK